MNNNTLELLCALKALFYLIKGRMEDEAIVITPTLIKLMNEAQTIIEKIEGSSKHKTPKVE